MIVSNLFGLSTLKVSIESKEQTVFRNAKGRTVFFDFFLFCLQVQDVERGTLKRVRPMKEDKLNFPDSIIT